MFSRIYHKGARIVGGLVAQYERARGRYGWFDHGVLAYERYQTVNASRLAAALTYTTFLALFPLLLVAYSILGLVLRGSPEATDRVTSYLEETVPTLRADAIADASLPAGLVGVIGLVLVGVNWIGAMRGVMRTVWQKEEAPENPGLALFAKVVDAGVLVSLFVVLAASLFASFLLTDAVRRISDHFGYGRDGGWPVAAIGIVAGLLFNGVLCTALLTGMPRLRMSWRRLLAPVVIGAIGLETVKLCAGLLLRSSLQNPAYAVVASAVGLLVFFNLTNRLLLWCAALAATSGHGEVTERPPPTVRRHTV